MQLIFAYIKHNSFFKYSLFFKQNNKITKNINNKSKFIYLNLINSKLNY